ncbi:hypothetical protein CDD83_3404 [Cordyceps sp. RAO-2017]|nr:hypothetical protein CDD83_3404 [Cordyceps sp. RAO-2017]
MGALALRYAKLALFVPLRPTALTMSSLPGHYPYMTTASSPVVMNQAPMSSSPIKIEPRGHGSLEDMSLPCENWTPDQHGQHHNHGHHYHHHSHLHNHTHNHSHNHNHNHNHAAHGFAAAPAQRGPRLLPPPDSLMSGTPSTLHSHHHPSPPPLPTPFEDRLRVSTPSHTSHPPSLPPPSTFPARGAAGDYIQIPSQQRGREAWILPSTTLTGSDSLPSPAASQPPPAPHFQPPQPSPLHNYPPRLQGAEFHRDAAASRRLNAQPTGLPPSQADRPPPPPPPPPPSAAARARQTSDGTSLPGMPNLLGAGRAQALSDIRFRLRLRQQPRAARACGFGDRDRRVIDPPPIVQLVVESSSMTDDEVQSYLRYESYVMNCAICDETGTRDASFMPEEYQHQRRLMGSLVGTPFVGQDENGDEGCFFCFGDLSCRTPGAFRLKFTLIMIDPSRAGMIRHFPILTEALSDVFHVYSAKEFPGMLPSSNLAKRLKEQGCIISIKKGNERSRNPRLLDDLSDMDEDGGDGPQRRRRMARD